MSFFPHSGLQFGVDGHEQVPGRDRLLQESPGAGPRKRHLQIQLEDRGAEAERSHQPGESKHSGLSSLRDARVCFYTVALNVVPQIAAGLGFDMASLINNPAFISMVSARQDAANLSPRGREMILN